MGEVGFRVGNSVHWSGGISSREVCLWKRVSCLFVFKDLFIFRESGREREKHRSVAFHMSSTWDLAHNTGMYPHRKSYCNLLVCRLALNPLSPTSQGKFSSEDMFIDLRERENIDHLPPVHAPTGDWTCNLLVFKTMLQPTEPPGQGWDSTFASVRPDFHSDLEYSRHYAICIFLFCPGNKIRFSFAIK